MKAEFPAANQQQESLDRILLRFDAIRPGTTTVLGKLAEPATIASLQPSECSSPATTGPPAYIAVHNRTTRPLAIESPDGTKTTVPPASWRPYRLNSGESLKLPDGRCLVAGKEPALAILRDPKPAEAPRQD